MIIATSEEGKTYNSLLNYYQKASINPVPIDLGDRDSWGAHIAKRRNLYERHLGIPLSYLNGRSVLEFGCNSGENALALAHFGANLTLVEPNDQVYPRLRELFSRYGYEDRIVQLSGEDVNSFRSDQEFDLVIAEGFINHLSDRVEAVESILSLVGPDGIAVISFDCQYGHFIEMTRKLLFWRSCELGGVVPSDDQSIEVAEALFLDDFSRLNASRPFTAWWQDVLLNPFVGWEHLWSYSDLIPLVEAAGGEFLSSSPRWTSVDDFVWHKNTPTTQARHEAVLRGWASRFPYFLTGLRPETEGDRAVAGERVIASVSALVKSISDYVSTGTLEIQYPGELASYLANSSDPRVSRFNDDLKSIYSAVVEGGSQEQVMASYHQSSCLRDLWGAPYHYVSFRKCSESRLH